MHAGPVARERALVVEAQNSEGEETTTLGPLTTKRLRITIRGPILLVKLHYLVLAPWILFTIPSIVLLGLQLPVVGVIVLAGLGGTMLKRTNLVSAASISLLGLLILGKLVIDLSKTEQPDTAILVLQFLAIILLMEASLHIVQYGRDLARLEGRDDELSMLAASRLENWLRLQLYGDARLGLAAFLASLGLLIVGGLASVQIGNLAVSAGFVLLAVIALLFLLTYRREPESSPDRKKVA